DPPLLGELRGVAGRGRGDGVQLGVAAAVERLGVNGGDELRTDQPDLDAAAPAVIGAAAHGAYSYPPARRVSLSRLGRRGPTWTRSRAFRPAASQTWFSGAARRRRWPAA